MAAEQRTGTVAEVVAQLARPLEAPTRRLRDLPEVSEAMLFPAMIRFMLHRLGIPVASACPSHDFKTGW